MTDQDLAILRLEERWPSDSWQKVREVTGVLRLSQARFQQRLRVLVRDQRAVERFPQTCAAVLRREVESAAKREQRRF